ncbi:MAG: LysR family transcriptional regulator [Myxococcota bacterium]
MHRADWDDLRYALAVADAGSLASAARQLGVDHTTVLRRVAALERELGARLFERLPTGYALTGAGEELVAAARQVSETVAQVERRIIGQDLRLTGTLRVATTDTLARALIPSALAAFAATHPELNVELTTSTSMVNLTKREADVAIRAARKVPENLVGRRVAQVAFALYASRNYLKQRPARRPLEKHVFVGLDDSLANTTIALWMKSALPHACVRLRTDTLTAACSAAEAGLGVAALPCYLGDRSSALRRLGRLVPAMASELWVLTHEDLRGTARVRALMDWLVTALAAERDLIEGRHPREAAPKQRAR